MFICAEMIRDVKIGEMVIVKNDTYGKGLSAFLITGEKVADITSNQADGCLDFWTMATRIENNRVLCTAVIKGGRLLILSTQSRVFDQKSAVAVPQSCRLATVGV